MSGVTKEVADKVANQTVTTTGNKEWDSLKGKVALVTGGSKGIGRGCALALAKAGVDVAINYLKDAEAAAKVVDELRDLGVRAFAFEADVTDRSALVSLYDRVEERLGVAEIIIANAGASIRRSFLDSTADQIQWTFDVIVMGCFHTMQEGAMRMIRANRPGRMVSVGSVHAYFPFPNALSYNVAKAALHHLTASIAAEMIPYGIHANVVVPGLTDTPGERNFRTEEELQEAGQGLPMGRMATPEEIGNLIRFVVSPENNYMTGSVITADGGIGVSLSVANLRSQPGG